MFSNVNVYKSGVLIFKFFSQYLKANKTDNNYLLNVLTALLVLGRGSVETVFDGSNPKSCENFIPMACEWQC